MMIAEHHRNETKNNNFNCCLTIGEWYASPALLPVGRSPCANNMVPVTVVAKMEIISSAKADTNKNRCTCFTRRVRRESRRLGAMPSLVSDSVTSTAPPTRAAGAPRLAHQSKAVPAISKSAPPPPRIERRAALFDDEDFGVVRI